MLKASWGGGGRGMRVVERKPTSTEQWKRPARGAGRLRQRRGVPRKAGAPRPPCRGAGDLGDTHGHLIHLFERDCSVQRRNQKVVERAPAPYLDDAHAPSCARRAEALPPGGYTHAGTVEFLMDVDSGRYYFIEVNPRIQVEHTVTEEVTGVDIVKAQIRISQGVRIGDADSGIPAQQDIRLHGHALQCRVTTEDPENNFTPDYGRITAYRSAAGFGVRLDGGTAYSGAIITPFFDSLLVKVTARGQDPAEAIHRMDRACASSASAAWRRTCTSWKTSSAIRCSVRRMHHALHRRHARSCSASPRAATAPHAAALCRRGGGERQPGDEGAPKPAGALAAEAAEAQAQRQRRHPNRHPRPAQGTRAGGFAQWLRANPQVMLTDTSMRDAHQSLFATRMRTRDMLDIAPYYARLLPDLLSWNAGAAPPSTSPCASSRKTPGSDCGSCANACPTFPCRCCCARPMQWATPIIRTTSCATSSAQAAQAGVDIFRVFDSLNWVDNMRVAMDGVIESGGVCEAAICYTGDIFDTCRAKFDLKYYVTMAKQLERPAPTSSASRTWPASVGRAHRALWSRRYARKPACRSTSIPTTPRASPPPSVLAAVEAGVDAVDGALDALSGLTSQPNLTSIADALAGTERAPNVDTDAMREISDYWEGVRRYYAPFEADIRAGTSDVYRHEMPGGQYTNLREQARAMGLDHRWPEVSRAYADVNRLFGDIVKVTPTSKVVGDMALFMVANDLSADDVEDPTRDVAFPESVVSLFKGELGRPPEGFPQALSDKVLQGAKPLMARPGKDLPPVDLEAERATAEKAIGRQVSDTDLASWLMYPKVFADYAAHQRHYGDVSQLPTPVFFNGLAQGEEIAVAIDAGKTLVIRLQGSADIADDEGEAKSCSSNSTANRA
jgi:pyruvate carboxylase